MWLVRLELVVPVNAAKLVAFFTDEVAEPDGNEGPENCRQGVKGYV